MKNDKNQLSLLALEERGLDMVPMEPGMNVRVFNKEQLKMGTDITWNDTGTVTLAAGTYHVSAFSLLTNMGSERRSLPGYCVLYKVAEGKNDDNLATGTMMNAVYNTPSFINTFLDLSETTNVQIQHQIGATDQHVKDIYLQVKAGEDSENTSLNHVFATLTIQQL